MAKSNSDPLKNLINLDFYKRQHRWKLGAGSRSPNMLSDSSSPRASVFNIAQDHTLLTRAFQKFRSGNFTGIENEITFKIENNEGNTYNEQPADVFKEGQSRNETNIYVRSSSSENNDTEEVGIQTVQVPGQSVIIGKVTLRLQRLMSLSKNIPAKNLAENNRFENNSDSSFADSSVVTRSSSVSINIDDSDGTVETYGSNDSISWDNIPLFSQDEDDEPRYFCDRWSPREFCEQQMLTMDNDMNTAPASLYRPEDSYNAFDLEQGSSDDYVYQSSAESWDYATNSSSQTIPLSLNTTLESINSSYYQEPQSNVTAVSINHSTIITKARLAALPSRQLTDKIRKHSDALYWLLEECATRFDEMHSQEFALREMHRSQKVFNSAKSLNIN